MELTQALKYEVHAVLVDMAINNELEGDINELDIDSVFDKAIDNLKGNDLVKTRHITEALGEYIIPDEDEGETLTSCYNRLKGAQANGNGDKLVDYYVTPVQRYEYSFTIDELLELVQP